MKPGFPTRKILAAALCLAASAATDARAVYLDPEGLGQALIFPYYTVRSTNGNPFNTYLSVINHEATAKALRVRFREGRNGREVAGFNLFLSPYDTWTGSLVPTGDGAKVVTIDNSCTNPPFAGSGGQREMVFSSALYSGANADGMGEGGDRTREGYVEVIEMATLAGVSAAAVTHGPSGTPENCAVVQSAASAPAVASPTGGLSGSGTLINVASGLDFTFNAEALAELTTQPFYRNYTDPYPDWDAAEVTPLSHFHSEGKLYRLNWARGVDAVSSVFMRLVLENEYVLDAPTRSQTDWVITFPTRRLYAVSSGTTLPFTGPQTTGGVCQRLQLDGFSREERSEPIASDNFAPPAGSNVACWSATVLAFRNSSAASRVFGSVNITETGPPSFDNGWANLAFTAAGTQGPEMRTLPGSWSSDLNGANFQPAVYVLRGLPVVGFMARTFENGTLTCGATRCQGNYGGSFPHKTRRSISVAP